MYREYGNRGFGGRGDHRDFNRTPPVREGEEIDVRIESIGEKGDGIAKKDGFVLFVPNVKEGDEVRIKVTKVLRKVGFAEVLGAAQGPVATSQPPERKPRSAMMEKAAEMRELERNAQNIEDSEEFGEEDSADAQDETVESTSVEEEAVSAEEAPATDLPEEAPESAPVEDNEVDVPPEAPTDLPEEEDEKKEL